MLKKCNQSPEFVYGHLRWLGFMPGPGIIVQESPGLSSTILQNASIKNSNTTYAEYSRRGTLLRTDVPNTQPHLVKSRYITQMDHNSYLVYEKNLTQEIVQQILPASSKHPEGWRCKQVMSLSAEGYEKPGKEE